jgi:hypothetical protein
MEGIDFLTAESLMEMHRRLIHSSANEEDNSSLAQPSPLRFAPSKTTDCTETPSMKTDALAKLG